MKQQYCNNNISNSQRGMVCVVVIGEFVQRFTD